MLKREYENSTFATYYDSCVRYEKIMNFSERVKIGKLQFRIFLIMNNSFE